MKELLNYKKEMIVEVRRKDGSIKKQWQENFIGRFLRLKLKELRIPLITGMYKKQVIIKVK